MYPSDRVLFFDAVGTLFGIRGTVGEIYSEFAQQVGVTVEPIQLDRAFMDSFKAAPRIDFVPNTPEKQAKFEYEWWREIAYRSFEATGATALLDNFDPFFRDLFDHFATAAPWFVYPEVPEVLTTLAQQNISLAIISNFDSRLYQVLEALSLDQWFTSVTLSTQVGVAKPDPDIFAIALQKAGCSAAAAWHVGDSWSEDYQGAMTAGLQGIWLNRTGQAKAAHLEITDLAPLPKLLQG